MKLEFSTDLSPIFTYQIEVEPEHPPTSDRRNAREIFQQEVQTR